MSDVYVKYVRSWGYEKTFPRKCDQYLGRKTGKWFDKNLQYILCGGVIKINTKDHTAECKKCGSKWQEVRHTRSVCDKAQCPFCGTPDPEWEKDHSKHDEDKIIINCLKCSSEYFIKIGVKHFVQPSWILL